MRPAAVKVLAVLAICGLTAFGATAMGGTSAGPYGVGLELGKVVNRIPVGSSIGPWLVWNSKTCSYEVAKSHPSAYVANVRKVVGGPTQIGYMHYGDTDPFGVANSKNVKKMAALAGFKLDVYNLKYPSETEPLAQARTAVLKHDKGVMQAQQLDTLSNAFLKILQKDGCIPSVQMYLRVKNVPSFGAVWADTGTTQGQWLAQQAKALVASGFKIPGKNVFKIICKYSQTQSAQVNVKAWFTGHPNFKHVMINTIDDERMQGAINALNQVNRFKDALTIASGADGLGQQQIKAGLEGASIAYFPERYGEWLVAILEDVMAGNPVPSFTGSKLIVITKANIKQYYP
jgi:hypothetical protein